MVVLGEAHLRWFLAKYAAYYNELFRAIGRAKRCRVPRLFIIDGSKAPGLRR